ncbi:MAG: DUF362 domain-containing protein [Halobacteriales archaeon]
MTVVVDEETILEACPEVDLPEMGLIEQRWETDPIPPGEVAAVASDAVADLALDAIPAGGEVAVGAGSRGIANVAEIVRGTVAGLADRGYDPFVFPAMGSHGGATAEGQREQLASLGITEDAVGCPIRSSMAVIEVGETPERGVGIYADANAAAADAIVPVNRIKPHTTFFGDVESGLSKMIVIGMGKQRGAKVAHEWAVDWSLGDMVPEIAATLLAELPIAGGIGVVEDQHHETAIVEGVPPRGFLDREAALLERAYELMPALPFEELELLVVDRMGKDVSGAGMDTNVIGRIPHFYEPEPETPEIKRIFARSLTDASHGNAAGVGNADLVQGDLVADWDPATTLINGLTASAIRVQSLPPAVGTDRAGLVAALSTIGVEHGGPDSARVLRVTDTQSLERLYASTALVERARERADLRVIEEPEPLAFEEGSLLAPSPDPTG